MSGPDYGEEERRLLDDLETIAHAHGGQTREDFVMDAISFAHASGLQSHGMLWLLSGPHLSSHSTQPRTFAELRILSTIRKTGLQFQK